nr:transposase [Nocardiopsis algeriensis]
MAFPEAWQVVRIERHRRRHGIVKDSREVVLAVTDLDARQVSPAELTAHARKRWTVENHVHHVRDVAFKRTHAAPAPEPPRSCWGA